MNHDLGDRPQRDASRDDWLRARGLTVMRVAASEAMRNADEVADAIVRLATEMILSSAPFTAPQPVERRASFRTPYGAVPLPRFAGEDKRQ
jgi:hypothetical protein